MTQVIKAQLENNRVINIAAFDPNDIPDWANSWMDIPDSVKIGDVYDGLQFLEYTPTAEEISAELTIWRNSASTSRRSFCLEAYRAGFLTESDAVLASKGEWPTAFDDALAGMPSTVVAEAKIEWGAVSTIYRNAPLLEIVRQSKGFTEEQVDALFS